MYISTAVQDFYSLLVHNYGTLHLTRRSGLPTCRRLVWVRMPTHWGAEERRDEVVELLQQLPYLRLWAQRTRWTVGPGTVEIAYCVGELQREVLVATQPVPGIAFGSRKRDT
jgi:hypothetical protein